MKVCVVLDMSVRVVSIEMYGSYFRRGFQIRFKYNPWSKLVVVLCS